MQSINRKKQSEVTSPLDICVQMLVLFSSPDRQGYKRGETMVGRGICVCDTDVEHHSCALPPEAMDSDITLASGVGLVGEPSSLHASQPVWIKGLSDTMER